MDPRNSLSQNTVVGNPSLLQGIFPTQRSNQVSHIAGRFFTSWATREAQEYWSGLPIPSPVDLPNPGIEPGSPALQADSLPIGESNLLYSVDWFKCYSQPESPSETYLEIILTKYVVIPLLSQVDTQNEPSQFAVSLFFLIFYLQHFSLNFTSIPTTFLSVFPP